MSHALPAPLYDLDAKRILATAGTIAVHLLALMLLLAPMKWTPPAISVDVPMEAIPIDVKPIRPMPPPPHPIEQPPRPVTHAPPQRAPVEEPPPVVSDDSGPMATPYVPVDETPQQTFNPPPSGPVALTVIDSPAPTYPLAMIRQNVTGKVVLRIEVDATGHPVSGVIESSSGSSMLDKAALKVVLAKWRFVPAQYMGQPIAATALVPIIFSLD
jgi:protein TonB